MFVVWMHCIGLPQGGTEKDKGRYAEQKKLQLQTIKEWNIKAHSNINSSNETHVCINCHRLNQNNNNMLWVRESGTYLGLFQLKEIIFSGYDKIISSQEPIGITLLH